MAFAVGVSHHPLPTHAVGEVIGQVLDLLGEPPDLALLFVTAGFAGAMEDVAATVRQLLAPGALIGTTATALLAGRREIEHEDAIVLFAASWGGRLRRDAVTTVHLDATRDGDGWRVVGDHDLDRPGTLVLLADPYSFPTERFVEELGLRSPGLAVVGGLASAGQGAGANRLVAGTNVRDRGAVGIHLPEGVPVRAVVSQGCRPVGEPLVVTRATGNLIEEIAGMPALDRVLATADAASPEDRALMAGSIQVGLAVDERVVEFGPGDFLIRQVLGADRTTKAVAVGAEVRVGTTVQFHVRDRDTADQDLRAVLAGLEADAALAFTCTGRGFGFFGVADHDATVVSDQVDDGAVAGMFCAGEIGPVGGRSHVHGFSTAVLLLAR